MEIILVLGISLIAFTAIVILFLVAQHRQRKVESAWTQLATVTRLSLYTLRPAAPGAFNPPPNGAEGASFAVHGEHKGVEILQKLVASERNRSFRLTGPGGREIKGTAKLPITLPQNATIKHRSLVGSLLTFKQQTTGDDRFDSAFITTAQMPLEWTSPHLRESLIKLRKLADEITLTDNRLSWVVYKPTSDLNDLRSPLIAATEVSTALREAICTHPRPHEARERAPVEAEATSQIRIS